jgi:hypothetical protein
MGARVEERQSGLGFEMDMRVYTITPFSPIVHPT